MEHGASEIVKKQSLMEMTIKTDVEAAATSTAYIDIEIDFNYLKQEPGSVQSVKSEPESFVKEEILEDSSQKDGNEQQCVEDTPTPAGSGSVNEACSSTLGELLNVKHELEEMDIGPTVLQHMDIHYAINKNVTAGPEENKMVDYNNKAMPCYRAKKWSIGDKLRDNKSTSFKNCGQTKTEEDYNTRRLTCLGQQKDLQQDRQSQHQATSSSYFKCNACERTFHKQQLLSAHKKQHQRNKGKTLKKACGSVTGASNQSRDETLKVKQKPFVCDICEKGYYSKVGLSIHKRLHSGKGLSVCHICDAKFGVKSHLASHLRMHSGEKPYQCDTCHARFAYSSALTTHMRVHTGEKPYHCDTCDASFAKSDVLTKHMRIHTGEKPYKCNTCDTRFSYSSALTIHMRVHTGEKPYQCATCNARFVRSSDLTKHMKVHMKEKPHQ